MIKQGNYKRFLRLQHTPMGDFVVVKIVTADPLRAYNTLATSMGPWAAE